MPKIPVSLQISTFMHCGKCLDELPEGISPREYASLEVGFTEIGIQVWCKRHDCNVIHLDFYGFKPEANTRTEAAGA